jgi:Skp family chaperone for outer membrane proteins
VGEKDLQVILKLLPIVLFGTLMLQEIDPTTAIMWRWTHNDLMASSQKMLDAANLIIEEDKKEILELRSSVKQTQQEGEKKCVDIETGWQKRLEDRANDLLAQLTEAKAQIVLWRDAFLAAKGYTEKSMDITTQVLAAKKDR